MAEKREGAPFAVPVEVGTARDHPLGLVHLRDAHGTCVAFLNLYRAEERAAYIAAAINEKAQRDVSSPLRTPLQPSPPDDR